MDRSQFARGRAHYLRVQEYVPHGLEDLGSVPVLMEPGELRWNELYGSEEVESASASSMMLLLWSI